MGTRLTTDNRRNLPMVTLFWNNDMNGLVNQRTCVASHLLSRPIVSWLKGTSDSHRLQLASFLTHLCACSKTLCISGHTYRDQGSAWSQQHRLTLTDSFLTKNTAWLVSRTKPLAYSLRDSSWRGGGKIHYNHSTREGNTCFSELRYTHVFWLHICFPA